MAIVAREAKETDCEAVAALLGEVQALHAANRPDAFEAIDAQQTADWTRELFGNPSQQIWVAELDGLVRGYLVLVVRDKAATPLTVSSHWLEIDQIAVQSGYRRLGIARALVAAATEHARATGVSGIELSSWSFNQDAHRTFASLGFAPKVVRFERAVAPEPGEGSRE